MYVQAFQQHPHGVLICHAMFQKLVLCLHMMEKNKVGST